MSISQDNRIIFIIYAKSQERAKLFYMNLFGLEPALDVPGMTEFVLSSSLTLGIMPEDGIVRVLEGKIPHPKNANGIPRCEIYVYVDDPDKYYDKLEELGGVGISRGALRSWGDYASYGFDPDGHIIAFATKKLD